MADLSTKIEKMREAGRLTAQVLTAVSDLVRPGITTLELDAFCEDYIRNTLHAIPGSKGQYDYPYSINTSVNHVVCHGLPTHKPLLEGDIVNIDITVKKDGFYGDSSKMFCVGNVSPQAKKLVQVTQECLYRAIKIVKPGTRLGDIGHAIQMHAEKHNYTIVQEYCGHGIGEKMHEEPQIMHWGRAGTGKILEAGMTFTIEPMINMGKRHVKLLKDNWNVVTKDRSLSAQWEHTILVTETGFEVLTLRPEEAGAFT